MWDRRVRVAHLAAGEHVTEGHVRVAAVPMVRRALRLAACESSRSALSEREGGRWWKVVGSGRRGGTLLDERLDETRGVHPAGELEAHHSQCADYEWKWP